MVNVVLLVPELVPVVPVPVEVVVAGLAIPQFGMRLVSTSPSMYFSIAAPDAVFSKKGSIETLFASLFVQLKLLANIEMTKAADRNLFMPLK